VLCHVYMRSGRVLRLALRQSPTLVLASPFLAYRKVLDDAGIVVHQYSFTCASAASVWGSQKVISMAR
jgi:hypothetical protein